MPFERELVEQRSLFDLPMSHHGLQSCQIRQTESLIPLRRNSRNGIDQNRTYTACVNRVSISSRSSAKSIGFVSSPVAPLSSALRLVSASP
jgi:hypothetical protein